MFLWFFMYPSTRDQDEKPMTPIEQLWLSINMTFSFSIISLGIFVYASATLLDIGRKISIGELLCQAMAKEVTPTELSDYLDSCINQLQFDSLLALAGFLLMIFTVLFLVIARIEMKTVEQADK